MKMSNPKVLKLYMKKSQKHLRNLNQPLQEVDVVRFYQEDQIKVKNAERSVKVVANIVAHMRRVPGGNRRRARRRAPEKAPKSKSDH